MKQNFSIWVIARDERDASLGVRSFTSFAAANRELVKGRSAAPRIYGYLHVFRIDMEIEKVEK